MQTCTFANNALQVSLLPQADTCHLNFPSFLLFWFICYIILFQSFLFVYLVFCNVKPYHIFILIFQQSCRSSLADLMERTSLDLELDLQASRTRQRQLNEEICTLRELRQRLEDAQLKGQTDLPHWVLRDDRFRNLLKEAERQV